MVRIKLVPADWLISRGMKVQLRCAVMGLLMTPRLPKPVVFLLFCIGLSSPRAVSQVREYTLGATLDRYVCYDKTAQLKASAPKGSVQPLEAGVEHFFARTRLIRLSFRDVSSEVQQKLLDHFLISLRLWYLACTSCPPQSAAIVKVGDDFWVIRSFVAALDQADSLAPQPPRQMPVVGARVGSTLNELLQVKRLADTGPGRRRRDGMQLSDYVRVQKSDAVIKRLCAEELVAIDPRLAAAWQGLCSAGPTASQYELAIVEDGGECGSKNVVACGLPRRGIQLNAGMFRFFDYRDRSVVLGDGAQAIDLLRVTLHETGHWIGLRDSDTGNKDIMTGTYASGNCLGNGDVDALAGIQISGDQPGQPRALLFPSNPGPE